MLLLASWHLARRAARVQFLLLPRDALALIEGSETRPFVPVLMVLTAPQRHAARMCQTASLPIPLFSCALVEREFFFAGVSYVLLAT